MRAKFIFEGSLKSLDVKDVVTKDTIDSYDDEYVIDMFVYEYANEHELDGVKLLEDEEFKDSEEFKNWMKYKIEARFHETKNAFRDRIIEEDKIDIWREMMVSDNWIEHLEKQGNRLGEYWSWDPDAAESHGGYGKDDKSHRISIESSIEIEHINWVETIKANMHPNYVDEREIRLFKNTPLKIKAIYDENNIELNINKIKNKKFKA